MPKRKLDDRQAMDTKAIGRRLRQIRDRRALSQTKLAQKVGITQTLVSDYETGRLRLNAGLLVKFARALRVSADEILGLKETKQNGSVDRRFVRRLEEIESLSRTEKQALLKTIDHFLRGAQAARSTSRSQRP